jgi:hypothetical protein
MCRATDKLGKLGSVEYELMEEGYASELEIFKSGEDCTGIGFPRSGRDRGDWNLRSDGSSGEGREYSVG